MNIVPKKSEFDEYEIGIFDTDEGKMIEVSFKNGFWVMLKPEIADQLTLDIQDAINYLKEKK